MIGARTAAQPTQPSQSTSALQATAAILRLLRPTNAIPAAILVLLGARLLDVYPPPGSVWRAAAAMLCITTFGYVTNDLADLAEDRINKPQRPLASGRVAPARARSLALALALLGLSAAASVSLLALLVAAAVLLLLHLYNVRLKTTPALGNLLIGGLAGCALLAGGVAVYGLDAPRLLRLLPPALTLALFVTGRELLKTLEDLPGDRAAGKQTLALRRGTQAVAALVALAAWLTTAAALSGVVWLGYSGLYAMLVSLGVLLPLHAAALDLWRDPRPTRARRWLVVLKGSYAAGLLALWLV